MSLAEAYRVAVSEFDGGDSLDAFGEVGSDYGPFDRVAFLTALADHYNSMNTTDMAAIGGCLEICALDLSGAK